MSKVYVLLAEGFEEIEALTPVDLLRRAGTEVVMVSTGDDLIVTGARKISVKADILLSDFEIENLMDADVVVLPGGMPGTTNLKENSAVRSLVNAYFDNQKNIAAICAAPTVFGSMGLLRGKLATCYPGLEAGLEGAVWSEGTVVVDKNGDDGLIITSRGVGTAIDFALKLLEILYDKTKADEIGKSVVYGI